MSLIAYPHGFEVGSASDVDLVFAVLEKYTPIYIAYPYLAHPDFYFWDFCIPTGKGISLHIKNIMCTCYVYWIGKTDTHNKLQNKL